MGFRRFRHRDSVSWQRRLSVGVALLAYLIAAVGVPLPAYVRKQSSTPFPCQHHACGCATAEQCWQDCCCYSPEQKLAWAHENHVQPPESLVAQVASIRATASHCAAKPSGQCCAHRNATAVVHEHDEHDQVSCEHASCHEQDGSTGEMTLVIGSLARTCRGLASSWCTCGAVLPQASDVAWQFEWVVVEWVALDTGSLLSNLRAVPVPPPRV